LGKYGLIRIGAATPSVAVADPQTNLQRICTVLDEAVEKHVSLLIFPHMCLTGATASDLKYQSLLLDTVSSALDQLADYTADTPITIVVGAPLVWDGKVVESHVVISGGVVKEIVPCGEECVFEIDGALVGFRPGSGAQIIVEPAAEAATAGSVSLLVNELVSLSRNQGCAYVYCNAGFGESTTNYVTGGKAIICENGSVLAESKAFSIEASLIIADVDVELLKALSRDDLQMPPYPEFVSQGCPDTPFDKNLMRPLSPSPFIPSGVDVNQYCSDAFDIQAQALARRMMASSATKVVIGISGGLDSTLALLASVRCFDLLGYDRKGIIGISMPGFGTSSRTHSNAAELMRLLGVSSRETDIRDACLRHFEAIGHPADVQDLTFENTQARERTQILFDVANMENALVVGTGDLSELALGWCTYSGDQMSSYAINASIPKTVIRQMCSWAAGNMFSNAEISAVISDIVATPVSPELKGDGTSISQKTEDVLGPYELHDFFIYYFVRYGFSPEKILFLCRKAFRGKFTKSFIQKCLATFLRRFFSQQFKRSCAPDGPLVTEISLSPRGEWSMPSDVSARLWLENLK